MAAIDKTYINSYKEYKELLDWTSKNTFNLPTGQKLKIYCYNWKESDFNGNFIPVMNTSCIADYYLIKYCPLKFVQDRMKEVYDKEYIDSILNGTSKYDTFTKDSKYGKHVKILKRSITTTPVGCKCWWISVIVPDEYMYLSYDEVSNKWIWPYELKIPEGEWSCSSCLGKIKTIKSLIRNIIKWQLPLGTKVKASCRYIGFEWEFEVKK